MRMWGLCLAVAGAALLAGQGAVAANPPASVTSLADCTSRFVALSDAGKLGGVTWGEFRATVCGLPSAPAKGAGTGTAAAGAATAGAGLPAASQTAGPATVKAPAAPSVKTMTKQFAKKAPATCQPQKRNTNNRLPLFGKKRGVCG